MHTQHLPVASIGLYGRLRERWAAGIPCPSDVAFAFGVSFIWLLFYNVRFWELAAGAMWRPNVGALLFMVALVVLTLTVQALLLLLWPTRGLMRGAASALFLIAAPGAYFCSEYGAIMNKEMMRNVLQTDRAEVAALMNPDLWLHVVLLGLIPAVLVWRVRLPETTWKAQLAQRALAAATALSLSAIGLFANSADYATFLRQHKPIRFMLSPVAQVTSMAGLLASSRDAGANQPLLDPAGTVQRTAAPAAKPLVLFLVIGETARGANFQLGGYARATNPELKDLPGLTYFANTASCGTSTAISVPCLFSHLPRAEFKVDEAGRYTNLLDALVKAGFDVQWRDNNSGCKGVCTRVPSIEYSQASDPRLCTKSNCFDEVMLKDLPDTLRNIQRDTVIVFHQQGSHGPAYFERYPPQYERFQPACRSNQLAHCSQQEITNAYDNTIAYTDHVLAQQIGLLSEASAQIDSVLIYTSDHGESLGENGIYLHGLPYAFAPAVQKEVPMLIWVSEGYTQRARLQPGCLDSEAALLGSSAKVAPFAGRVERTSATFDQRVSHDFFYHTVLAAAEVRDQVYDRKLDLISGCRRGGGSE